MFRRLILTVTLVIFLAPAAAMGAFPKPTGFVNDFAKAISPDTRAQMEGMLASFERQTGIEVTVATLPSLNEEPIENVAVALFAEWGIGKKANDNGVLFLVAPNERRTRIEVGYGLEGAINDALAGRILDERVLPRFREGDMSAGIAAGTLAIVTVISKRENLGFDAGKSFGGGAAALAAPAREKRLKGPLAVILKIAVLIIMIIVFIRHPWLFLLVLSGMGRGGAGGGRGFSGGFGGFGGGLSGGGGASRGW